MADDEVIVSEDGTTGSLAIQRTGGRPPFEVTEANRDLVLAMTVNGVTAEEVAETLGISPPTLLKYFREELEHGRRNANAKVARSLYRRAIKAEDGDKAAVTAAIFWLKTRAHWRETDAQPAGGTTINVLNILDSAPEEVLRWLQGRLKQPLLGEGQE
jgi:hypothetical protein